MRLYEENVSKFIHTNFDGQRALKHALGIKRNFKSSYKTKLSCSYQGEICSRTGKYNSPTLKKMYKKSVCLNIVIKWLLSHWHFVLLPYELIYGFDTRKIWRPRKINYGLLVAFKTRSHRGWIIFLVANNLPKISF